MPLGSFGKDKLVYDPNVSPLSENDNVGAFVRAGSDGQPITWTNVGLAFASYTGIPAGCATSVTIDADVAGAAGNITLTGDGASTITQLIAAWNLANPTNTVTLSSGNGGQTPNNGATIVLSGGSDGKDGLDVNIINDLPITTKFEYHEDTQHNSGDIGAFALAVRHDADTTMVDADGDYAPLQVTAAGRLKVDAELDVDFDYVYAEDSQFNDQDLGAYVLSVRQDTLATDTSNTGDFASFKVNDRGALWSVPVGTVADDVTDTENPVKIGSKSTWAALAAVTTDGDRANLISDKYRRVYINNGSNIAIANNTVSVTTSEVELKAGASRLEGRRLILVQNLGNKEIYLGKTGVASTTGLVLAARGSISFDLGQDVGLFAIGNVAGGQDVRVFEMA